MRTTTYTPADLAAEARATMRTIKRTLPAPLRRSVHAEGWELRITNHNGHDTPQLIVKFRDENGPHEAPVLI